MKNTQEDRLLTLMKDNKVLRPRDLMPDGLSRTALRRLTEKGLVRRIGRGLYMLGDEEDVTEFHCFAEACKRVPHGVVCLLSALNFHQITTQSPPEIWLAIDRKKWAPKKAYPPLRIIWLSGAALSEGVEEHEIEGVPVKIYSVAKTVADCFKYRNKIGLDVALEALREALRGGKCTSDEIWYYAKICRVANVMRPYLEAMV